MTIARSRKKSPRILATSVAALLGLAAAALADPATWIGGTSNVWSDNANWTAAFPNSPTDVATFDVPVTFFTPTISSAFPTITVGEISFTAAAPTYTVTLDGSGATTKLTFAATGVTNGSVVTQNFVATGNPGGGFTSTFLFTGGATAGTNTSWTLNDGAIMQFDDSSSAGGAAVTIEGGARVFFNGTSNGGTSVFVNNAGGVFDISVQTGGGLSVNSISGGGNIFLGANTLTTGADNNPATISGVIQDGGLNNLTGGALTKTGTGVLTLSGANTYTGATTISNGTIALTGSGSLSDSTAVNISGATGIFDISGITAASETVGSLAGVAGSSVVLGSKNLTAGGTPSTTFDGVISGTDGSFTKTGSGNLTLTAANTYTGVTTISAGTVTLSGAGSLADTSAVNLTGSTSTFDISGITAASETVASLAGVAGSSVSLGAKTLIAGDSNPTTFAGILFGTGGGFTKQGTGTITLTGTNTYTGATTINGGTLKLSTTGSLSPSTAVNITSATGIFDLSTVTATTETIGSLAGVAGSSVVLGAKNLNTGGDNTPTTNFAGVLSGTGGSLTKVGTGTMTLSGANTYTGATTVNGGTLVADSTVTPTVLNSSSALVLSGSTFRLTGSPGNARMQLLNGLTINAGNSVVDVNNTGTTTTLDLRGPSGTQGITRNGNGSVDFRASTGVFSVNAIVFTAQPNNASGIIGIWATVNNGTAFAANDGTGKIVAVANNVDINALGPNQIMNGPATNVRITALGMSGPVPIASATTNINTLSQQFTTASTIDTSPGLLRFGIAGGILIGSGKAALTIGTGPNSGRITAGGDTTDVAGDLGLNNASASTLTINSAIVDNGTGVVSVTKVGSGLVTFAGTNTYTGATTIAEGTLSLTGLGSLADTGAVNLTGATSIFDLSGITATGETIGSLAGIAGSSVVLGAKNLTVGGDATNTTFAGVISGVGGSLTKSGTGKLALSGANTYSAGTTLSGGTLYVDNNNGVNNANNALGPGTLTITGGILGTHVELTAFTDFHGDLTGTRLPNNISLQGDFSIASNIDVGNPGAQNFTLSGNIDLNNGVRTITGIVSQAQIHFSGVISNGANVGDVGGLTFKVDPSIATYVAFLLNGTAANTYTGLTTIGNGAFVVVGDAVPNGAIQGNVLVLPGGSLDYFISDQVADTATVTVNSTGLNAGQHFAGLELQQKNETIDTLLGTGTVGLSSGNLTVNQGDFSGQILNGDLETGGIHGNLVKNSAGTLTLSGVNTFQGVTSITAGTVALTGSGSLLNSSVNIAASAKLDITGISGTSTTIGSLASASTTASVVLGGKTLNAGNNNGSTTFAGVISGAGGGLTKVGTGTLTLTGVNTYTGTTTANGGTLSIDATAHPVLDNSSRLAVGGGTFQLVGTAGNTLQIMSGLTVNAGSSVVDVRNTGTMTTLDLRGPGGALGITHNVGGSVDFQASMGVFGTDAIVRTTQTLDASGIIGAWATVNNGAALATVDNTGKIIAFTNYFDIAAQGPPPDSVIPNDPTKNVRINTPGVSGDVTLAASTTSINTLTQNTAQASTVDTAGGTLRLGVAGGIFILSGKAALTIGAAPNSGFVTAGGGTDNTAGELILGNANPDAGPVLTINSAVTNNGTGVVSLTKNGTGRVILAGTNTYTGPTTIGVGMLALTGAGAIADVSAVNLAGPTAVFSITGINAASETVGSLAGVAGSSVVLGAKNLTAGGDNSSTTFAGIMSGTGGSFTKLGTGTMTLTGANTYSGVTTVSAGTLNLNTTGADAIAGNLVINGGTVVLQQTSQIGDTKTVSVSGGGTFDIGSNSELVAGVQLIDGSILGTTGVLFSGTSFDVQSGTITANLSSSIDGVGLNKTTSGTVVLAGQNTYHGPTNVSGGVLILDGIINFGTNGVNVTNGSEFDVTSNGIVVVRDGVTAVTATDGNTITVAGLLQGGNNSTGILAANNNQITVTNSGAIVGGAVGFKGVVLTGSGNTATNSGFIGGDKAVILTNPAGDNAVVNYGTLQGVGGIAIDALTSGGNLVVTNDGDILGDVRFGVGDDTMTLVTLHPVTGIIDGGAGTNVLRLVGSFSDTLDIGSGYVTNFTTLYKGGGGTWTLTGEGAFPGGTTVNMGKLYVQGNLISNVLVQEMGFLGGTGTITGNLTNFGTVSPGNSPGMMTVKGNYDQGKKGNLVIQINGKKPGQYDVLTVGGHAQLAGTLTLEASKNKPRFRLGEKITFLTAEGGVDGKFKKVVNPFNSNTIIQTAVTYDSNSVSLEGQQGSYEEFARLHGFTPNQRATARAVDGAALSGRNEKMVDYLNSRPVTKIPEDLDRIAPEELNAVYRVGVGLASVQATNIQRRTDDLRLSNRRVNTDGFQTTGATPGFSGQLGAPGEPGAEGQNGQPARPPDRRWGAFLNGMGEWIRIGDTENARGYDFSTGGVTVGVDYRATDHFAVGASAGYAGTGAALAQGGKMRVNSGKVGVYATYYDGGFYADAAVSGGYNNYETQRAGLQGTARGKTDGGEFNALLGGGYDWSLEALTLGALTSIEYTYLGLDNFTERGSLAPLSIPGQHGQSLRSKLGFKAVYDWQLGGVLVKPEFRAVWQHEYGDRSFALDSQLASGDGGIFTVHDSVVSRDSLLLGVGASMLWSPRAATYLYYDGEIYRKESESHNVTGGVRISF